MAGTCCDHGDELGLAAAIRAALEVKVDVESEASGSKSLHSSHVVAKTRLSGRAKLNRGGLWCTQFDTQLPKRLRRNTRVLLASAWRSRRGVRKAGYALEVTQRQRAPQPSGCLIV